MSTNSTVLLKDAPPFQIIDYVYIGPTFLSIAASFASIWSCRKAQRSFQGPKNSPLHLAQLFLFGSLIPYHILGITVYYMEMLLFDRRVTNFDAFYGLRFAYTGLFIFVNLFLFSALAWLMLFWNKIMVAHFLSIVDPILKLLNNTAVVKRLMFVVLALIPVTHLVLLFVAFDDGIRLRMMLLCIEGTLESILFLVTGVLFVDMMGLVLRYRFSKGTSGNISRAVGKLCLTCALACLSNALGFLTAFGLVASNSERLGKSYPRNEIGSDKDPFVSIRIDGNRFFWGFTGVICSIPFLLNKSQKTKNFTEKTTNDSSSKSERPRIQPSDTSTNAFN